MNFENLTDRELVENYLENKSEPGFVEIYERCFDPTYRYVRGRVDKKEDAEDIVEETFMIFLDVLNNFSGKSKLTTFIIGIARNKLMQFYEKQKRKPLSEIDNLDYLNFIREEDPEKSEFDYNKYRNVLDEILDQLKPNYEEIIRLRFIEGNSYTETAKILGKTRNNIKVTQHRALKKAREIAANLLSGKS